MKPTIVRGDEDIQRVAEIMRRAAHRDFVTEDPVWSKDEAEAIANALPYHEQLMQDEAIQCLVFGDESSSMKTIVSVILTVDAFKEPKRWHLSMVRPTSPTSFARVDDTQATRIMNIILPNSTEGPPGPMSPLTVRQGIMITGWTMGMLLFWVLAFFEEKRSRAKVLFLCGFIWPVAFLMVPLTIVWTRLMKWRGDYLIRRQIKRRQLKAVLATELALARRAVEGSGIELPPWGPPDAENGDVAQMDGQEMEPPIANPMPGVGQRLPTPVPTFARDDWEILFEYDPLCYWQAGDTSTSFINHVYVLREKSNVTGRGRLQIIDKSRSGSTGVEAKDLRIIGEGLLKAADKLEKMKPSPPQEPPKDRPSVWSRLRERNF
jgi:hypothetical protein